MLSTWLFTLFKGKLVGKDYYGNCYFEEKKSLKPRRWVIYKGDNEASKTVPEWNRWLHYTTDVVPNVTTETKEWQKPHIPNMTGTLNAYDPSKRLAKSDGKYYSSWEPRVK